jgi:hypothetical protein
MKKRHKKRLAKYLCNNDAADKGDDNLEKRKPEQGNI